MGEYVLLGVFTNQGAKTYLKAKPYFKEEPARLEEINKAIEAMGVKIKRYLSLLGPFDFLIIIDAPDNETITKVSVELAAKGNIQTTTLPAIEINRLIQKMKE